MRKGETGGKIRFAANERKLTRISKVVDYSLPYHCQGDGGFQFYQKATCSAMAWADWYASSKRALRDSRSFAFIRGKSNLSRFSPCACLIPFAILNKPSTDSSLDLG